MMMSHGWAGSRKLQQLFKLDESREGTHTHEIERKKMMVSNRAKSIETRSFKR